MSYEYLKLEHGFLVSNF